MELTDGVVTLRSPRDADAAPLVRAVQESLGALVRFMPWASPAYGPETAREWMRRTAEQGEHGFLVHDEHGALVGSCGLNRLDALNRAGNLGYWVHSRHTGRGLATRAARLVARFGHGELGLHRIEISASVENPASCRVAERVGATFEGVLRGRLLLEGRFHDACLYSLLPGDVT